MYSRLRVESGRKLLRTKAHKKTEPVRVPFLHVKLWNVQIVCREAFFF